MAVDLLRQFSSHSSDFNEFDGDVDEEEKKSSEILLIVSPKNARDSNKKKRLNPLHGTFKKEEDPAFYMSTYDLLKKEIEEIDENTAQIEPLIARYMLSEDPRNDKQIIEEMDAIILENLKISQKIRKKIEKEKGENERFSDSRNEKSSVALWRSNHLQSISRHFKLSSLKFEKAITQFKKGLKAKNWRQITHFSEGLGNEERKEMERIVEDPLRCIDYIHSKVTLNDASDVLLERVDELEKTKEKMENIEKSINELQILWKDLQELVVEQSDTLDSITLNVDKTFGYIRDTVPILEDAETMQKRKRKCGFYGMVACFCALFIALFIFFPSFLKN